MGNICISKPKVEPNIIRKSNREISIQKSERFYRSNRCGIHPYPSERLRGSEEYKDPNIPTNSYVVFRSIIRDPTKHSLSGSFLNKVHLQEIKIPSSYSDLVNIPPIRHSNQSRSIGSDYSFDIHIPCINLGQSPSEYFTNIPELTDTVGSMGKNNSIHILDKDDEFIQAIKIALMRTKIAIDTCTYDESRPKFHGYSMVPFIDIFH